jgi:hypothetical protein
MLQLLLYDSTDEVPKDLESQIHSLLRAEWPPLEEDQTDGPLIAPQLHPVYFILAEGRTVLSYARTIWARVTHLGRVFKLYGLNHTLRDRYRPKMNDAKYPNKYRCNVDVTLVLSVPIS